MKQQFTVALKSLDGFSLFLGIIFGAAIGLGLFSYALPGNTKATTGNTGAVTMNMDHDMNMSNPYDMGKITTEAQFLKEMKLHHEAAVQMAQEVLTVRGIHPEVKNLANAIIGAQTSEIKMMSDWIATWKY
jgi:uncharacterized protein (DUF305 family)